MSKIMWNTDVNAPCCPGEIINCDNEEETILIQVDYDYCGVAMTFGWDIKSVQDETEYDDEPQKPHCDHPGTDGTVKCPKCGISPHKFIESARNWLEDHDGATVDDPGYFS